MNYTNDDYLTSCGEMLFAVVWDDDSIKGYLTARHCRKGRHKS